ncbi:MAG TPA: enoyl-CoA hydratase-related protein [Candidatus Thermoplasmatota archaeon]|nr:enoyl-CoA hydratase-related protein [Candidatus Thermoplasmatota archaeon]
MTSYENLLVERDGPVAVLTVNRPKSLNALNGATLRELKAAAEALDADPGVAVVIVTGAGEKAFVAGADISEMASFGPLQAEDHARRGQATVAAFERMRKPVIAAVNGYALGGGLELALACDVRVASENAVVGLPEVSLAVIPGFGGTQRLARLVGPGVAKELVFTGRKVKADEALQLGLVNRVVPQAQLLETCRQMARDIVANGPYAVRLAKEVIDKGLQVDLESGLEIEQKAFGLTFATHDQKEGMRAFLEKRKPAWKGE